MLDYIRQGQRWIVTALVVLVGAVFVLFFGPWDFTQTGANASVPVQVDGVQYTINDVQRVAQNLERQYRESLGENYDELADQLQLEDQAVRQLVDRAILTREAQRLGLAASDAEVESLIKLVFSDFRDDDGRLDEERARQSVIYEWGSVRAFKETVAMDIVLRKMGRLLLATAGISEAQARASLAYREEEVRIAFVSLDPANPPDSVAVIPGDVDEFQRNEAERIAAYHQENLERYQLPERMRLRHVLVRIEDDEAAARSAAEAARKRIEAGEDMASVARDVSDDEGSQEQGGDLGLLPVDQIARALRGAVSELEPGQLAPTIVRTDQGFHVVRLEERRAPETRTLEEVAGEIADELYRSELGERWAEQQAEALGAEIASGQSLEAAARTLKLNIERTGYFRRRPDGYIEGLGDSVEALTAAFALSEDTPTWPEPIRVDDRTVFVQLLERRSPDPAALDIMVGAERARLEEAARARAEQAWLAARRTELQAAGRIQIDPSVLESL